MYHRLFADPAELAGWPKGVTRFWVAVSEFERQVRALTERGYRAVPLAALVPGAPPPAGKPLVITFDDGWESDGRLARPILERAGWASEHFVTVDWIGTPGFMSWTDLEALGRRGGAIQSHSLSHRDLDRLPAAELRAELEGSRRALRERLSAPAAFFALPGGTGSRPAVRTAARAAGYRGICTSRVGLNVAGGSPYALRRLAVLRTTPLSKLLAWVEGEGLRRLAMTRATFRLSRRVMPRRLYAAVQELALP
ncbi:MAG TPA: polysaccharide deacetylase family protein [Methylomirabilota bacterium]|nr:polysaccharide deacetylase family protein [Methylomirabilota bacterium]